MPRSFCAGPIAGHGSILLAKLEVQARRLNFCVAMSKTQHRIPSLAPSPPASARQESSGQVQAIKESTSQHDLRGKDLFQK